MFDHGAHEEDGPVTREVRVSPWHGGRSSAKGTEVTAEGDEEVGGLHTSVEAGELVGNSLEHTQKGALDITAWLVWFLVCLNRAFDGAGVILANVLRKARFWERITGQPLNELQRKVIHRLLDGFEGMLASSKWATRTRTSLDTALRDIKDLLARGILVKDEAGGRSTSYSLAVLDKR